LTSRKGELYLKVWASTKKIESLEVESGLSKTELALRLRHEIKREFASYVGISWERHFGQTKEMVGERDLINFLVGLKTWFRAFSLHS
jgi:copper resistance protein B